MGCMIDSKTLTQQETSSRYIVVKVNTFIISSMEVTLLIYQEETVANKQQQAMIKEEPEAGKHQTRVKIQGIDGKEFALSQTQMCQVQ